MEMYERLGSLISKRMEDEVHLLVYMQSIDPRRFKAAVQSGKAAYMTSQ
jgi:hypothetical protein